MAATVLDPSNDFLGVSDVHFWKVTKDDASGYEAGDVMVLSPTAEISQTTEQSQATVHYSNVPAYVVSSKGATTISAVLQGLALKVLAILEGTDLDSTTGALIDDGEAKSISFGISFRADYIPATDGARYYSFPKVNISIPDEATKTKDGDTGTLNQSVTITAVSTIYKFTKTGKSCKRIAVDTVNSGELLDLTKWFDKAVTPDSLEEILKSA